MIILHQQNPPTSSPKCPSTPDLMEVDVIAVEIIPRNRKAFTMRNKDLSSLISFQALNSIMSAPSPIQPITLSPTQSLLSISLFNLNLRMFMDQNVCIIGAVETCPPSLTVYALQWAKRRLVATRLELMVAVSDKIVGKRDVYQPILTLLMST